MILSDWRIEAIENQLAKHYHGYNVKRVSNHLHYITLTNYSTSYRPFLFGLFKRKVQEECGTRIVRLFPDFAVGLLGYNTHHLQIGVDEETKTVFWNYYDI